MSGTNSIIGQTISHYRIVDKLGESAQWLAKFGLEHYVSRNPLITISNEVGHVKFCRGNHLSGGCGVGSELVAAEAEFARREGRSYEPASALLARNRTKVGPKAAPALLKNF